MKNALEQELDAAYDAWGVQDRAASVVANNCDKPGIKALLQSPVIDSSTQNAVLYAVLAGVPQAQLDRLKSAQLALQGHPEISRSEIQEEVGHSLAVHVMQPLDSGILLGLQACKRKTSVPQR